MTLAGLVLGGGIAAAATMNTAITATGSTSGQTDVGALLSAASTSGTSGSSGAASSSAAARADKNHLGHLRRAGGMYGTITYQGKDGKDRVLGFERGQIVATASSGIVVRAQDGTTMTWTFETGTVVRQHGAKATTAALAVGQAVFVGGPVISHVNDARLIVIRTAKAAPA